jgi:hypothetical protein
MAPQPNVHSSDRYNVRAQLDLTADRRRLKPMIDNRSCSNNVPRNAQMSPPKAGSVGLLPNVPTACSLHCFSMCCCWQQSPEDANTSMLVKHTAHENMSLKLHTTNSWYHSNANSIAAGMYDTISMPCDHVAMANHNPSACYEGSCCNGSCHFTSCRCTQSSAQHCALPSGTHC